MKNEEQTRFLFGISLSDIPKWKQFLICSSGFFFGYLVNGICEEYVYNRLQFSVIGVIMVIGALVMDSFLGNLQEAIFNMNPETTQMEMLFCSTVVGLPLLIPPMVLTEEVFEAWNSCSEHLYVYGVLVFEAMATFIGQVSVLSLIAIFGAATTAMVTTARKAVTLLLSYMIFTKPLTQQHGTGLILIAMGITLKLLPVDVKPVSKRVSSASGSSSNGGHEIEEEENPMV
ncbi:hypothetical protein V6Z11_D08G158400 [Gossypium hirsutum]